MYYTIGSIGSLLGVIALIFLRNPVTKKLEIEVDEQQVIEVVKEENVFVQFANSIKELWKNPTAKWVTIGGSFRFFESFTIVYFLPSFYQHMYPLLKSEFGILNGLIQGFGGMISIIGCGVLGDKLE